MDWAVRCTPDTLKAMETEGLAEHECSDRNPAGAASATRAELAAASSWLKSLCFRGPEVGTVRRPDHTYEAWIADEKTTATGGWGQYDPETKRLYVSSDHHFVLADNEKDLAEGLADTGTMVHELFHAVQEAYSVGAVEWVSEGTADAVMLAWLARHHGAGMRGRGKPRYYDDPLHRPRSEDHAYRTRGFWRWLGQHLGAAEDIGYLADAFEVGDFTRNEGLSDLQQYLESESRTLYKVYPTFIADYAYREQMYSTGGDQQAVIRYKEPEATEKYTNRVKGLAADAVKVKAHVPADKLAILEIRIRPDHEDLHLVVDRQLLSTFALMPDGQAGFRPGSRSEEWQAERNRFITPLTGHQDQYEFFVRVANASQSNPDKSTDRDYTLEIELRPIGDCKMSARVRGNLTGSYSGDVAHFSTRGAATSYGAFANPEFTEGIMKQWGGMLEQFAGEEGAEVSKALEGLAQQGRDPDIPRETFGLSLTDQKLEDDDEQAALAAMLGGFTLEASAVGTEVPEGFTGAVPLKMMRVVPGPRHRGTLDKVPFVWAEGKPGDGRLEITRNTGDYVVGRVSGTLYSDGYLKSDGSKAVINVDADFIARPGPMGCLPVGNILPF